MDSLSPYETETSSYDQFQFGDFDRSYTEALFEDPFLYQFNLDSLAAHDNPYPTLDDSPNTVIFQSIPQLTESRPSIRTSDRILEASPTPNTGLSPLELTSRRESTSLERQPTESTSHAQPALRRPSKRGRTEVSPDIPGSGCISFDGVAIEEIPNKGRKGGLSRPNRKKVAKVRAVGACPRCRARKISCSEVRPCNPCIKAIIGRPPVCWKAAKCVTISLLDANVFTETLFAFPYVDLDRLDPVLCPTANEVITQYFGQMEKVDSIGLILCHQDFQDDITSVKCQQLLASVGGQLYDLEAGLDIEALPHHTLLTVMPLMESAFSQSFKANLYNLLGRYGVQGRPPKLAERSFQEDRGYCSAEKLVENASIWYRSGTNLLKELERALQAEFLIKCGAKRANLLILYVLYMMSLVGKARSSPLPNGPPNEALESRVNTLLQSLTCALVLLHRVLRPFPEDGLQLSSVESAVRLARNPYETTVVPRLRLPATTNPRLEKGKRKRRRDEPSQPIRNEHDSLSVAPVNAKRSALSSGSEHHYSSIST